MAPHSMMAPPSGTASEADASPLTGYRGAAPVNRSRAEPRSRQIQHRSSPARHSRCRHHPWTRPRTLRLDPVTESSGALGKAVLYVQCEFQGAEGAVGFDEVVGSAGQAGQYVVDHGCVGAGGGQVDGPLSLGGALG